MQADFVADHAMRKLGPVIISGLGRANAPEIETDREYDAAADDNLHNCVEELAAHEAVTDEGDSKQLARHHDVCEVQRHGEIGYQKGERVKHSP